MKRYFRTIQSVLDSRWGNFQYAGTSAAQKTDRVLQSSKLEDCIYDLMESCTQLLSDKPLFVLLNSYTTGLSASVMSYLLQMTVGKRFDITVDSQEIGLPVKQTGMPLPAGSTAIVHF